jgi:hypothetical protein
VDPVSKSNIRPLWLLLLFLFLTCGCGVSRNSVVIGSSHNFPYGMKAIDDSFWWRCRFTNVWPKDREADGAVDLLLAHAVVSPVLSQYTADIAYWRFHRRALRDSKGHQFTFLFYSKPEIASAVFAEIDKSEVLKDSLNANIVRKVVMDNPGHPQLPNIGHTSDRHWSSEVQKNWPSYIMGVSSLWLGLIDDYKQKSSKASNNIGELLEEYREVDAKITDTWRNEGQHAFLHHLNAVFGYEPMLIKKELSF